MGGVVIIIMMIVVVFIIVNALYALIPKFLIAFSGFHESSVAFFTCFRSGVHRYLSQVILILIVVVNTIVSFTIILKSQKKPSPSKHAHVIPSEILN